MSGASQTVRKQDKILSPEGTFDQQSRVYTYNARAGNVLPYKDERADIKITIVNVTPDTPEHRGSIEFTVTGKINGRPVGVTTVSYSLPISIKNGEKIYSTDIFNKPPEINLGGGSHLEIHLNQSTLQNGTPVATIGLVHVQKLAERSIRDATITKSARHA